MPSRKVYRKSRKDRKSRKTERKAERKSRKNRKQYGGNPMAQSLAQGEQFAKIHSAQHGGAYLTGAPLSEIDGSMLPSDLRSFARVEGLDASINDAAAQGPDQATAQMPAQMPAQTGGKRSRKSRKNRKASRKNRKSERKNRKSERKNRKSERKNRKSERKSCRKSGRKSSRKNRKSRRQAGGSLAGAPVTWESRFLSDSDAAKAGTADFSNPLLKN